MDAKTGTIDERLLNRNRDVTSPFSEVTSKLPFTELHPASGWCHMMKSLAAVLPEPIRTPLRSLLHNRQIAKGAFRSPEPEWDRLSEWLVDGDVALDIGANVGHYSCRMSELVGANGRVVAFEPVPSTFSALTGNAGHFKHRNVTLVNAAVGDCVGHVGLSVPNVKNGSYLAHIDPAGPIRCLVLTLDSLALPGPVKLVKIDAEGYEPNVLMGMNALLKRDQPVVILERNKAAEAYLIELGYEISVSPVRTPNIIARRV
jgi:FkbM family methyltransferase